MNRHKVNMKGRALLFQCSIDALNDPAAHATGAFVAQLKGKLSDSLSESFITE